MTIPIKKPFAFGLQKVSVCIFWLGFHCICTVLSSRRLETANQSEKHLVQNSFTLAKAVHNNQMRFHVVHANIALVFE
ncbi:MAG: hypothetical protein ACRC38_11440 [Plesiomonas sp.]